MPDKKHTDMNKTLSEYASDVPHKYDIHIAEDGRWYHEGGEIKRMGLVKLFASVLSCEEGAYWLRTPVEAGVITVDDAPFIIIKCTLSGSGEKQVIEFGDNLGRSWTLGAEHPLEIRAGTKSDEPRPYLHLEKGLTAKVNRPVFYELANAAIFDETDRAGIWSGGTWFLLETNSDDSA